MSNNYGGIVCSGGVCSLNTLSAYDADIKHVLAKPICVAEKSECVNFQGFNFFPHFSHPSNC